MVDFQDQSAVRAAFIVAFFTRDLSDKAAPYVRDVFERWLSLLPPGTLDWALIGPKATRFKKYTARTADQCRGELKRSAGGNPDPAVLRVCAGTDPLNPVLGFTFVGVQKAPRRLPEATGLLEIRWPLEYVEAQGCEAYASHVAEVGALLPYRSGYASPALCFDADNAVLIAEASKQVVPLAFKHRGYDVPDNRATRYFMPRDKCRGARWLTLLGEELVSIMGRDSLKANLAERSIAVQDVGNGLMLRASDQPELGDTDRGDLTPRLREVAELIEPITLFDDWRSLGSVFLDDKEKVLRWERRHLD